MSSWTKWYKIEHCSLKIKVEIKEVVPYFPFIKVMKLDTGCAAAAAGTVNLLWPIYGIPKNHVFPKFF